jgi:hypothetical protein
MALEKNIIRDGKRQIIGSVTTGFDDGHSVVRNKNGDIIGRASTRYNETRDSSGRLVSSNTADPGLLINRKK